MSWFKRQKVPVDKVEYKPCIGCGGKYCSSDRCGFTRCSTCGSVKCYDIQHKTKEFKCTNIRICSGCSMCYVYTYSSKCEKCGLK